MDDKGLIDRQKFREDILKVMENHGLSSATIQYVVKENRYCDYDDFITSDGEQRADELGSLLNAQNFALYHSQEVLEALTKSNTKENP